MGEITLFWGWRRGIIWRGAAYRVAHAQRRSKICQVLKKKEKEVVV